MHNNGSWLLFCATLLVIVDSGYGFGLNSTGPTYKLGCFKVTNRDVLSKRTNVYSSDSCTAHCKNQKYVYAAIGQKQCFCLKSILTLLPSECSKTTYYIERTISLLSQCNISSTVLSPGENLSLSCMINNSVSEQSLRKVILTDKWQQLSFKIDEKLVNFSTVVYCNITVEFIMQTALTVGRHILDARMLNKQKTNYTFYQLQYPLINVSLIMKRKEEDEKDVKTVHFKNGSIALPSNKSIKFVVNVFDKKLKFKSMQLFCECQEKSILLKADQLDDVILLEPGIYSLFVRSENKTDYNTLFLYNYLIVQVEIHSIQIKNTATFWGVEMIYVLNTCGLNRLATDVSFIWEIEGKSFNTSIGCFNYTIAENHQVAKLTTTAYNLISSITKPTDLAIETIIPDYQIFFSPRNPALSDEKIFVTSNNSEYKTFGVTKIWRLFDDHIIKESKGQKDYGQFSGGKPNTCYTFELLLTTALQKKSANNTLCLLKKIDSFYIHYSSKNCTEITFKISLDNSYNASFYNKSYNPIVSWNFGDDTHVTTKVLYHTHSYKECRKGQVYKVTANVSNILSYSVARREVYIGYGPCSLQTFPPWVTKKAEFSMMQTIYFGTYVNISCLSDDVIPEFRWEIRNKTTNEIVLMRHERSFYVEARNIGPGEFTFTFNVTLRVQSQVETGDLKIYRRGVEAVLKQRGKITLKRNETDVFKIDGSHSYDLDNPQGIENIKFNWSCTVVGDSKQKCFKDSAMDIGLIKSPKLTVRLKDLQTYQIGQDSFLFKLFVSSEDGKYNSTDNVKLDVMNADIGIGPEIECVTCHLHNQSAYTFMLFKINCLRCAPGVRLKFQWKFRSGTGKYDNKCIKEPHSKLNLMSLLGANIESTESDEQCFIRSVYKTRTTCTKQLKDVQKCTRPVVSSSYSIPIEPSSHLKMYGLFYEPYFTAAPPEKVQKTASVNDDNIHVQNIKPSGNSLSSTHQSTEVNVQRFIARYNILGEYNNGGSGEAFGFFPSTLIIDGANLYGKPYWSRILTRPNLLKSGERYQVKVEVKSNMNKVLGRNSEFQFNTDEDIKVGSCTINSERNGIELETMFTVTCERWSSTDPLYYSIQVKNHENRYELVFVSRTRIFMFLLRRRQYPSNTENVQIVIENTIGQSKRMCRILLQLKDNKNFHDVTNVTSLRDFYESKTNYTEREFKLHVLCELIGKLNEINSSSTVIIQNKKASRDFLCQQVIENGDDVPLRIIANVMKLITHAALQEMTPSCMGWILNKTGFILKNINDASFLDQNNHMYREDHVTIVDDVIKLSGDQIEYYLGAADDDEKEKLKLVMARLMNFSVAIKSYQFITDRNYKNITINTYQKVFNGSCHIQLGERGINLHVDSTDSVTCYERCLNITVIKYTSMKQPMLDGHNTLMDLSVSECFLDDYQSQLQFDLFLDFQIPLTEDGEKHSLKLQEKNWYNVCSSEAIFWVITFKELPSSDYSVEMTWKKDNTTIETLTYPSQNCTNHSCTYLRPYKDTTDGSTCYTLSLELHKSLIAYSFRSIPYISYNIVAVNALCSSWNSFDSYSNQSVCITHNANVTHVTCKCERPAMVAANFKRIPLKRSKESTALGKKCFVFDCYLVPITVSVFIIVVFLSLIWWSSRDQEKEKPNKRKGLYVLPEMHPFDMYKYDVIIETGHSPGAGTSSRVCFVMHGTNSSSEKTELTCDGYDMFSRSAIDLIPFSAPQYLGDLKHITVWHNNEGDSPDWFIKKITVKDKSTGLIYFFPFYSWLSLSRGIKKTNTNLVPAAKPYMCDTITFFEKILDYHTLLSVLFAVPARSRFSRNERLALILVNFLLYLMTSAYLSFILFPEEPFHRRQFHSVYLLKTEVVVNMVYLLLVIFLYNFIITFCLRNGVAKRNSVLIKRKTNKVDCYATTPGDGDKCGDTEKGLDKFGYVDDYFVKGKVMYDEWSLSSVTSQKVKHSSAIVLSLDRPFWFRYVGYALMAFTGLFSIAYLILQSSRMITSVDISIWLHLVVVTVVMDLLLFSSFIAILGATLVLCFPGLSFTQNYLFSFMDCMQKHHLTNFDEINSKRRPKTKKRKLTIYPASCFGRNQSLEEEESEGEDNVGFEMNMAKKKRLRFVKYAEPMKKKEREDMAVSKLKTKFVYKYLKEIFTCVIMLIVSLTIVSEKSHYDEKVLQSLVKTDLDFKVFITAPEFWDWTKGRLYSTLTNMNWPEPSSSNLDIIQKYLIDDAKMTENNDVRRSRRSNDFDVSNNGTKKVNDQQKDSSPENANRLHVKESNIENAVTKSALLATTRSTLEKKDSLLQQTGIDISKYQEKFAVDFDFDKSPLLNNSIHKSGNTDYRELDELCDPPILDENQDDENGENDGRDDEDEDEEYADNNNNNDYWTHSTPTPYPELETPKHVNRRKRTPKPSPSCKSKLKAMRKYWIGKLGRVFSIINVSFVRRFANDSYLYDQPLANLTLFNDGLDLLENVTQIDVTYTMKSADPSQRTIFCMVHVTFSKHVSGVLVPSSQIYTYQFSPVSHFRLDLLFLIAFNFFFLYEMFKTFLQKGIMYFGSVWHVLNFCLVFDSFLLIVCSLLSSNIFDYYLSEEFDTAGLVDSRLKRAVMCRDVKFFLEGLFFVLTCFRSFWFLKFHNKTRFFMSVIVKTLKPYSIYMVTIIAFVSCFAPYVYGVLFVQDLEYDTSYVDAFISLLFSVPNPSIQVRNSTSFSVRFCVSISFMIYIASKLGFIFFLQSLRENYTPKIKKTIFVSLFKRYWLKFRHGLHYLRTRRTTASRKRNRNGTKVDVKCEFQTYLLDEIDFQLNQVHYICENINNSERCVHQEVVTVALTRFVEDEFLRDEIIALMLSDYIDVDEDKESVSNSNFDNSPRGFDSMVNNTVMSTLNNHTSHAYLPQIHYNHAGTAESSPHHRVSQTHYEEAESCLAQLQYQDADWPQTHNVTEQGNIRHNSTFLSKSESNNRHDEEERPPSCINNDKITLANQNCNLNMTATSLTDPMHVSDLSQNSAFQRVTLNLSHIDSYCSDKQEVTPKKFVFAQDNYAFVDVNEDRCFHFPPSRQQQQQQPQQQGSSPRESDYQQYGFRKQNPVSSSGSGSSTRQDSGLPSRTSSNSNSSSLLSERNSTGDIEQQNRANGSLNSLSISTKINEPFSRPNFNNYQYESEQNQKRIKDLLKSKKSLSEDEVKARLRDVWERENSARTDYLDLYEESKQKEGCINNLKKDTSCEQSYRLFEPKYSLNNSLHAVLPSNRENSREKVKRPKKTTKSRFQTHERRRMEFYSNSAGSSSSNTENNEKTFARPTFDFQTDITRKENENMEMALRKKKKKMSDEEVAQILNYTRRNAAKSSSPGHHLPSDFYEHGVKERSGGTRRVKRTTKSSRPKREAETDFGVYSRNKLKNLNED